MDLYRVFGPLFLPSELSSVRENINFQFDVFICAFMQGLLSVAFFSTQWLSVGPSSSSLSGSWFLWWCSSATSASSCVDRALQALRLPLLQTPTRSPSSSSSVSSQQRSSLWNCPFAVAKFTDNRGGLRNDELNDRGEDEKILGERWQELCRLLRGQVTLKKNILKNRRKKIKTSYVDPWSYVASLVARWLHYLKTLNN